MASINDLIKHYEVGPVKLYGDENASYERHLVFDHIVSKEYSHIRHKFEALAYTLRDLLAQRWLKTRSAHYDANPKRVYYLSMEFLIGRSLTNNITNLLADPLVREVLQHEKIDINKLLEWEPDA